ncbi:arabinosyltransferase domain-containing protein [Corynebacterium amycolatum]|uniref:arabinosyltransferase domain-containing protein n=1 Tax=Corynebacterium amycolatum TaxID=43765 RepID=UPI002159E763|nr:arabinosyltransferase domain-containing protein [Corynebacterium amycolatum]UVE01068.1 arabinosyltransferase domain-containing protein [Corynebacterium amycolatum]
MTAETKEIKESVDGSPEVTIDRVERPPMDGPSPTTLTRWTAIIAGIVGFICFVITPFLPVVNTQSSVSWPQRDTLNSVDAPLMAQAPLDLSVDLPLSLTDELSDKRTTLLSTIPPTADKPTKRGLMVRSGKDGLDVILRDSVVMSLDKKELAANKGRILEIRSTEHKTTVNIDGAKNSDGEKLTATTHGDYRPQVTGIYTDLPADGDAAKAVTDGLDVHMNIDSRYTSHPTVVKYIVMYLGLLLTLASLVALARIDRIDGSSFTPLFKRGALKPTPLDILVGTILVVWHFIGGNTSDDGYIFTMARVSDESGYMANYYRWFGAPESPFGSPYYDLLSLMVKVSTSSLWMRLPALLSALLVWFIISRMVIPRLGEKIAQRRVAYWSAAGVLLAFWLPYNNGLRPEPVIALGSLLTWVFIERAILTRRLLPAAVAVVIATLALGSGPTGLMAVAALLAGIPMLVRIVVERHKALGGGWQAPLMQIAPFLAAGTAILVGVFGDQTLATVRESIRVRSIIGPSEPWYNEFVRYYWLVLQSVDGAFPRRFPVLIALTCLTITIAALLRHRTVPGALAGPSARLVFMFIGTMFFLTFTPTKWTHHFGVYAGIAASLAALAAMAISHWVAGNPRNQLFFAGGITFILAFSLMGINGWWYVSSYGVPWFDKTIQLRGHQLGSAVLALALLLLLAGAVMNFVQEFRTKPKSQEKSARARRVNAVASSPIAVTTLLVTMFMVASLGKGAVSQYPAYSVAAGNIRSLAGQTCNMASDVLMETDPNDGFLNTVDGKPLAESLRGGGKNRGFDPNGVPSNMKAEAVDTSQSQASTADTDDQSTDPDATVEGGSASGTDGGKRADKGVNGSQVELPFGLDPDKVPVLGSYSEDIQRPASLETSWFQLPEIDEDHPLLVVSAAGRIFHHDINGVAQQGRKLVAEYGRKGGDEDGFEVLSESEPIDIGPAPTWRNLRFLTEEIPEGATAVRLVAEDNDVSEDQWLALTPPRLAELQSMTDVISPETATIPDWPVAFQFPCQRPFDHYAGVAELPEYRITPDRGLKVVGADVWQSVDGGGPLGFSDAVNEATSVPTYLKNDWRRDWGSVEKLSPRPNKDKVKPDVAEIEYEDITRSGLYSPGKMIVKDP